MSISQLCIQAPASACFSTLNQFAVALTLTLNMPELTELIG